MSQPLRKMPTQARAKQVKRSWREAADVLTRMLAIGEKAFELGNLGLRFQRLKVLDLKVADPYFYNPQLATALEGLEQLEALLHWSPTFGVKGSGTRIEASAYRSQVSQWLKRPHGLKRLSLLRMWHHFPTRTISQKFPYLERFEVHVLMATLDDTMWQLLEKILAKLGSLQHVSLLMCDPMFNTSLLRQLTGRSLKTLVLRNGVLDLINEILEGGDEVIYQTFAELPSLTCLDLSENDALRDKGLSHLNALTNLTSLSLAGAPISSSAIAGLSRLSALKHLDVAGCFLTSPFGLDRIIDTFQQLTHLDISNCGMLHSRSPRMHTLTSLKHLRLGGCKKLSSLKFISTLTGLQSLSAGAAFHSEYQLEGLEALTSLTHLDLTDLGSSRVLRDDGLAHISGLMSLRELILDNNVKLTGRAFRHLSGLSQLTYLSLVIVPVELDNLIHLSATPIQKIRTHMSIYRVRMETGYPNLPEHVQRALYRGRPVSSPCHIDVVCP